MTFSFSKARNSFLRGGSASAAAAASGDATFAMLRGSSRRDFLIGECEPEQERERFAMMVNAKLTS